MSIVNEKIKRYQWKKGENFGKVVEVSKEDDEFLYFTDGSQIFKKVASEFLEIVKGDSLPFPGAEEMQSKLNNTSTEKKTTQPIAQPTIKESITKNESPLFQLIDKLSKKNVETFDFSMGLNLPKRDIFNMIIENSDENRDEIINEITNVAISQIEIDKLQEYLKGQINNFVNKYYNE